MFEQRGGRGFGPARMVRFGVLALAAGAVLGWVVMSLWNGLMPAIFGLKTLHFWQALGLLLARILVGGLRHGPGGAFHRRHRMLQRWEAMSPEERERFRQGLHSRFRHCRGTQS